MEFVLYEQKGAVGIITINREKALNALNSTVLEEIDAVLDGVETKGYIENVAREKLGLVYEDEILFKQDK